MNRYITMASYIATRVASEALRDVLNLIASNTLARISRRSVLQRYEDLGHDFANISEARSLDVAVPDRLVPGVRRRWIAIAGTTGVVTASTGLAGLLADIPTLIANSLMAIGEIASLYGFDVEDRHERAFAVALLFTRDKDDLDVSQSIERLHALATELERELGAPVEDGANSRKWLTEAARELTWYLVKRQIASAIPGIGSIVSGGVNAQFTSHTCRRARRIYHERFVSEPAPTGREASTTQAEETPETDSAQDVGVP